MLTAPASLVLLRPRAPCSPRVMERGCSGGLTGASARRFAPASASRREAGEGEMLGNEALRDALAAATQAAAEARAAADAARTAAAQADSAAERASKLLAAALSLQSPPLLQSTRVLPRRIIIVRHGESQGNLDETMYCRVPDPEIALTRKGHEQAALVGQKIKELVEADGTPYQLFCYVSPYRRSKQTCADIISQFPRENVLGVREEPQLREQDFGNFQDLKAKALEKAERNAYGRFFYRFPNGESGSDVFDRITIFEDHMVRDIDAGRFPEGTNLVVVTHGLALRIFLARWLHWTVAEYESVYNPPNCAPILLERAAAAGGDSEGCFADGSACDVPDNSSHTKNLYRLTPESLKLLGAEQVVGMDEMLLPETAWERTLSGMFDAHAAEDDQQCALPAVDYAVEGEDHRH